MTATARGRSPLTASTGAAPTAAFGVPREAGILSSDDAFWRPLLDARRPIGEGDLKLTDVTQRVHDASRARARPCTACCSTWS